MTRPSLSMTRYRAKIWSIIEPPLVWALLAGFLLALIQGLASGESWNDGQPRVLVFMTHFDQPSQRIRPTIADLKTQGLPLIEVDCDERPDLVKSLAVTRTPTLVGLCGNRVIRKIAWEATGPEIVELVEMVMRDCHGARPTYAVPTAGSPGVTPNRSRPAATAGNGVSRSSDVECERRINDLTNLVAGLAINVSDLDKAVQGFADAPVELQMPKTWSDAIERIEANAAKTTTKIENLERWGIAWNQTLRENQKNLSVWQANVLIAAEQKATEVIANHPSSSSSAGSDEATSSAIENVAWLATLALGAAVTTGAVSTGWGLWAGLAFRGLKKVHQIRQSHGSGSDDSEATGEDRSAPFPELDERAERFGKELLRLHGLEGRSPLHDATSGRLFWQAIERIESGEDEVAKRIAADLKRRVEEGFQEIHPLAITPTS